MQDKTDPITITEIVVRRWWCWWWRPRRPYFSISLKRIFHFICCGRFYPSFIFVLFLFPCRAEIAPTYTIRERMSVCLQGEYFVVKVAAVASQYSKHTRTQCTYANVFQFHFPQKGRCSHIHPDPKDQLNEIIATAAAAAAAAKQKQ